jgi:hypothetical protein
MYFGLHPLLASFCDRGAHAPPRAGAGALASVHFLRRMLVSGPEADCRPSSFGRGAQTSTRRRVRSPAQGRARIFSLTLCFFRVLWPGLIQTKCIALSNRKRR